MASSPPPFQVEDQTDEDFFDKLVDDDFGSSGTGSKFNEGNDSNNAKAVSNLSMAGVASVDGDSGRGGGSEANIQKGVEDATAEERRPSLPSNSIGSDSTAESNNDVDGCNLASDSTVGTSNESSGSGIKVIGWNSFYVDSAQIENRGSYSDFFSELGGDFADLPSNMGENLTAETKRVSGNEGHQPESLNDLINHEDYQGGEAYGASVNQNTNGQDPNSTEYWESLYPGWKYDSSTGQWYQVGAEAFDAAANAQGGFFTNASSECTAVSDVTSEVSYMQQSLNSAVGNVTETITSDNLSNWNQISQENSSYPEHMVFDPQYPGWYYDTIAQEWRTLNGYTPSFHSTAQDSDQHITSGFKSNSVYSHNDSNLYGQYGQTKDYGSQNIGSEDQPSTWAESYSSSNQQTSNLWRAEAVAQTSAHTTFGGNQQKSFNSFGGVPSHNISSHAETNGDVGLQSFNLDGNLSQPYNQENAKLNEQSRFSNDFYGSQKSVNFVQQSFQSSNQFSYSPNVGRSSAGRPPHALVSFGFGGKLIVMKDSSNVRNSPYGSQDTVGGSVSVLNLIEVVTGNTDASSGGMDSSSYFHALCQQSFPGPLVGGNVGTKDLSKWIDERIAKCESPNLDYRKGEVLKLLLSLLKISCQHYGKLRSPFGSDAILRENDTPESAVAKLFASTKRGGTQFGDSGAVSHCLQTMPSEGQMRATASEVQNLLVSGRKKEALQCAQEGQLWGPAIVLASQLGDQFYIETVKQMALRQLVSGSPLRTLCLLIAGKPAEVFSTDTTGSSFSGVANVPHQPAQFGANIMLDDWEENLAVITANRTKDDELVIIHLGDCLWKERSEIAAAHICYLVAEANFESYSDSARLCLIGADHWKFPRTYASPEAIQRTELYEHSKVLGNSQFILLPFQPYKLIYAHMLAEVGKVSDSLKYCQAILKSLKTGRAPEVETWKQLVLSLDERIKTHQQGGYTTNLAPAKLVGKLLNFFDSTAHRVVGGLPPPAPSTLLGNVQGNEHFHQPMASKVSSSQSTMAMSSLIPSASMEPISEWASTGSKMTMHNRSVSEPDIGRTPRQETNLPGSQGKVSGSGGVSRFRFGFGSQLLQKTVGLVMRPRTGRQAKLGEKNKFYYDEKLKRWIEEGSEPPAEEDVLPPPPTTASFQNGVSDYNVNSAMKKEGSPANGCVDLNTSISSEPPSGVPPIPPSSNKFSAHGRMGVRSRYVDTFNPAGGSPGKFFQSPSVPSIQPAASSNAKFFIPTPALGENTMESMAESVQESVVLTHGDTSASIASDSFQSPTPSSTIQRVPSMGDIASKGAMTNGHSSLPPHSRRTASWSGGSFIHSYSPPKTTEVQSLGEAIGFSPISSIMPCGEARYLQTQLNSSSLSEDLQEVEL